MGVNGGEPSCCSEPPLPYRSSSTATKMHIEREKERERDGEGRAYMSDPHHHTASVPRMQFNTDYGDVDLT